MDARPVNATGRTALAISPHLDDAVFSAGGTLARLADRGWRVVAATVFSASVAEPDGFALACQLDKGLSRDVDYMALRRAEDATACATIGVEPVFLPFREAPHRGYGSRDALFGPVREDDAVAAAVGRSLSALLVRLRPDLVLAPQAIGGHVDHVVTVRALGTLPAGVPVLWWHDFPYVARGSAPATPCADRFAGLAGRAVEVDLARKSRACAAYRSQIGFQFGGEHGLATALGETGGVERFLVDAPLIGREIEDAVGRSEARAG